MTKKLAIIIGNKEMKFKSLSPSLVQTATAITLGVVGVVSCQNSAHAVVELNLSADESNLSRPQLLVNDSQQLAILTDNSIDKFSAENTTNQYAFTDNQNLNALDNFADISSPVLIANGERNSTEAIAVDVSNSTSITNQNTSESIYIPIQSSSIHDSNSVSGIVNTQEQNHYQVNVVDSSRTNNNSNVSYSIPINVVPTNTENNNLNNSDKPILIAPVAPVSNINTNNSEQVININGESLDNQLNEQHDDRQLVGSVPIEVNYYNPAITPSMGKMVSPELPYLYPADEYLPDGERPRISDGYIWPAKGVLTSGYGWRWGRMHKGIDIAAPVGTPILAVADGKVIMAGWHSGGYGNLVKLKHYDGSITLYAHNSRLFVRRGQEVTQGQHIANMGSTGFSTGPHLHFEIHPRGQGAINPMALLPRK